MVLSLPKLSLLTLDMSELENKPDNHATDGDSDNQSRERGVSQNARNYSSAFGEKVSDEFTGSRPNSSSS